MDFEKVLLNKVYIDLYMMSGLQMELDKVSYSEIRKISTPYA